MEIGELFCEDLDSESLQPAPLRVVVVHVDQERHVVERRGGLIDFGIPVKQDDQLRVPLHCFGHAEEDVPFTLIKDVESHQIPVEGAHSIQIVDAQTDLGQEPDRLVRHRLRSLQAKRPSQHACRSY